MPYDWQMYLQSEAERNMKILTGDEEWSFYEEDHNSSFGESVMKEEKKGSMMEMITTLTEAAPVIDDMIIVILTMEYLLKETEKMEEWIEEEVDMSNGKMAAEESQEQDDDKDEDPRTAPVEFKDLMTTKEKLIVKDQTLVKDPMVVNEDQEDDRPAQYGPGRRSRAPGDLWLLKGYDRCRKTNKEDLPTLPSSFPDPPYSEEELRIGYKYGHYELTRLMIQVRRRWKTDYQWSQNRCEICRGNVEGTPVFHHHAKDCFVPRHLRPIYMIKKNDGNQCWSCFGDKANPIHRQYGCKKADQTCHSCARQGIPMIKHHFQSGICVFLLEEMKTGSLPRMKATPEEKMELLEELKKKNEVYEQEVLRMTNVTEMSMMVNEDGAGPSLFDEKVKNKKEDMKMIMKLQEELELTKDLKPSYITVCGPLVNAYKNMKVKMVLPPACKPVKALESPLTPQTKNPDGRRKVNEMKKKKRIDP